MFGMEKKVLHLCNNKTYTLVLAGGPKNSLADFLKKINLKVNWQRCLLIYKDKPLAHVEGKYLKSNLDEEEMSTLSRQEKFPSHLELIIAGRRCANQLKTYKA